MINLTLCVLNLGYQQDIQVIFSKLSALIRCSVPAVSKVVCLKYHSRTNEMENDICGPFLEIDCTLVSPAVKKHI